MFLEELSGKNEVEKVFLAPKCHLGVLSAPPGRALCPSGCAQCLSEHAKCFQERQKCLQECLKCLQESLKTRSKQPKPLKNIWQRATTKRLIKTTAA